MQIIVLDKLEPCSSLRGLEGPGCVRPPNLRFVKGSILEADLLLVRTFPHRWPYGVTVAAMGRRRGPKTVASMQSRPHRCRAGARRALPRPRSLLIHPSSALLSWVATAVRAGV